MVRDWRTPTLSCLIPTGSDHWGNGLLRYEQLGHEAREGTEGDSADGGWRRSACFRLFPHSKFVPTGEDSMTIGMSQRRIDMIIPRAPRTSMNDPSPAADVQNHSPTQFRLPHDSEEYTHQ